MFRQFRIFVIMKKVLLPLVLITFGFFSCLEDGLSVTFKLSGLTANYTLKAQDVVVGTFNITSDNISTDAPEFAQYNTSLDKISAAKLKSLKITINNPATEDWSFANSASLYLKGNGLDEVKIASKMSIDQSSNIIECDVEDVEVVEHIKSGGFTLRTEFEIDEQLVSDVDVQVDMTYEVTATAL